MKKLFVLLLALAVVGGALYAQATVTGYVRAVGTITEDDFTYADRLRLNLAWTSEDGNVMFKGRLQGSSNAAPTIAYAFGKIKLADGMFTVFGGLLDDGTFDIASGYSDYAGLGKVANGGYLNQQQMVFMLMPVDALTVALEVIPGATVAELGIENFGLDVKFALEGIGNIVLTSQFKDPFEDSALDASFQLTMVEGLTASLGYKGLASNSIYGIVNYKMEALVAEVATVFNVDDSWFYLEGYVTYKMGDVKLGALFGLDNDNMFLTTNDYWFGAELYYYVGKGQLVVSAQYGETTGFALPLVVRVDF